MAKQKYWDGSKWVQTAPSMEEFGDAVQSGGFLSGTVNFNNLTPNRIYQTGDMAQAINGPPESYGIVEYYRPKNAGYSVQISRSITTGRTSQRVSGDGVSWTLWVEVFDGSTGFSSLKQSVDNGKFGMRSDIIAKGGVIIGAHPNSFDELRAGVMSIPVGSYSIASPVAEQLRVTGNKLQNSKTWSKFREVRAEASGTIRVSFDLQSSGETGVFALGRIYINGVGRGTERQRGSGYMTFTEDFVVEKGDLIQLYMNYTGTRYDYPGAYNTFWAFSFRTPGLPTSLI